VLPALGTGFDPRLVTSPNIREAPKARCPWIAGHSGALVIADVERSWLEAAQAPNLPTIVPF
jgi:hypothetical protein